MAQLTVRQAFQTALHHQQAGRLAEAERMYRQILAQQPDHADALHFLGLIALGAGSHGAAVELIQRAIAIKPRYPEACSNLAEALRAGGRYDEGIAACQRAIALRPDFPAPHNNLGICLKEKGELDAAIAAYRRAISLQPNYAQAFGNLGVVLQLQGKTVEAIATFRQAIRLNPHFADAHNNLGNALKHSGLPEEAMAAYRQAIALKPDHAEALCNLGVSLLTSGQVKESIGNLRQAAALQPNLPGVCHNLGNALRDAGRIDEAIVAFRRAIAGAPASAKAYNNLGNLLRHRGELDDAIGCYEQAIALKPDDAEVQNNLGTALKDKGMLDDAIAAYRRAIAIEPDYAEAHSNLLYAFHFHPACDAKAIAAEHRFWNRAHAEPLKQFIKAHENDRDPDRRLRVGYVSPDLREHPVGRLILPLLANHDKSQFEIFAYVPIRVSDAMTQRWRSRVDGWRNIAGLPNEQAADLIRQDRIDILVDLTMHMAHNRLLVFARKPAPVQVTYLAYCSSTGLEAIDYRLSDPYLDPPGQDESVYSEKTVRLPEAYWCYERHISAPQTCRLPALRNGHLTFGCLNNFAKVSDPALKTWARILGALPDSRLVLHAEQGSHRQRVLEQFEQAGIATGRVRFEGFMETGKYFELHRTIDIALDTFPYGGGTTTFDALWMGVPVVSLAGTTAVGRGGASILSNLDLPELVAASQEDYISAAINLARDISRLHELRSTLRQRLSRSVLMDGKRFARNIEAAYRQMWRTWCGTGTI